MKHRLLILGVIAVLCLTIQAGYAQTVCNDAYGQSSVSGSLVSSKEVTHSTASYTYNAFGVLSSVIDDSTSILTSTKDGLTSTQTTHQTTISQWVGGSVKPINSQGSYSTVNADGITISEGTFYTNYQYSATTGSLIGANGGGESRSYDEDTGKLASHGITTDTYEVRDGQAIRTGSSTIATLFNEDGTSSIGEQRTSTSYNYASFEGKWLQTGFTTTNNTKMDGGDAAGSSSFETTTTTISRNADGKATGMGMTGSGWSESLNETGNTTPIRTDKVLQNVVAARDPVKGWYIKGYEWVSDTTTQTQN